MTARKQVSYRISNGPCVTGYMDVDDCAVSVVYTAVNGGAIVPGAVIVPPGGCPAEVVVVSTVSATTTAALTYDREVGSWCDPTTGAPVAVVSSWDETAPSGTAPTVTAYNLDGTVYAGAVSALVRCAGGADIETLDQVVCDGAVSYTHTTFVDTATLTKVGSLWRDASGSVIATPTGPFTLGPCEPAAVPFTGLTDAELRAAPVPVLGPLTDTQLRAAPVPVLGPLTDTQLRAAPVPVLGPLTDTQLRAAPVPVLGPLTDTQLRAAPVPVLGPLTDTQLRAAPVPVLGPLTDTQLRAAPVPVVQTAVTGHHESVQLCDPANAGAAVVVTTWWLDTSGSGVAPAVSAMNPDGTAWVGSVATLVDCARIAPTTTTATTPLPSYAEPSTIVRAVSTLPAQSVYTPAAFPLSVKLVTEPTERETVALCNPTTGAPVIVETWWRDAATPGSVPTVSAYNADGTAYAGAVSALVDCGRVVTAAPVYTPAVLTTSLAGTVAAGARSISVFNRGALDGSVDGDALVAGMGLNFDAPSGGTLAALAYSGVGTTLVITEVR